MRHAAYIKDRVRHAWAMHHLGKVPWGPGREAGLPVGQLSHARPAGTVGGAQDLEDLEQLPDLQQQRVSHARLWVDFGSEPRSCIGLGSTRCTGGCGWWGDSSLRWSAAWQHWQLELAMVFWGGSRQAQSEAGLIFISLPVQGVCCVVAVEQQRALRPSQHPAERTK